MADKHLFTFTRREMATMAKGMGVAAALNPSDTEIQALAKEWAGSVRFWNRHYAAVAEREAAKSAA